MLTQKCYVVSTVYTHARALHYDLTDKNVAPGLSKLLIACNSK
jgi:hypothetical protein